MKIIKRFEVNIRRVLEVKVIMKICFLSFFTVFSFTCFGFLDNSKAVFADNEGSSATIAKSVRLIKDREVTEIIKAINNKKESIADAEISVKVDNPGIARISIKDVTSEDQVDESGKILMAKADGNGQKAFIIRGLQGGSTAIHLDIKDKEGAAANQVINVKVIELKIEQKSW